MEYYSSWKKHENFSLKLPKPNKLNVDESLLTILGIVANNQ